VDAQPNKGYCYCQIQEGQNAMNTNPRLVPPSPHSHAKGETRSWNISRPMHGVLDYLMGALIVASPWLFGFSGAFLAPQMAVTIGFALIFISLVTHYELGVVQLLPFSAHRFTDIAIGIALLGAPWFFSVGGRAGVVFFLLGVLQLTIAALTRRGHEAGPFIP
jgi:hypothetical protein